MSRKNRPLNILRSTSFAHALSDMYWFIFPVLLPLVKEEFGLSYIQAGLLVTSFTIVTGLGSFITGYLGDRFGRRIILSGGFLIASLALILCSKSSFYWQLLLASALVGAAAPGIIGLLADHLGLILALQLSTIPLVLAGALFIYLKTRTSLDSWPEEKKAVQS